MYKHLPIYFVSRWMPPQTFLSVPSQYLTTLRISQAIFTKVKFRSTTIFLGIRALIPNFHFPFPHFDDSRATAVSTFAIIVQFL